MNIENLTDADKVRLFPYMFALLQRCIGDGCSIVEMYEHGEFHHIVSMAQGIMGTIQFGIGATEQSPTQPIFDADGWREMGPKERPHWQCDQVYKTGEWVSTAKNGKSTVAKIKQRTPHLHYRTLRPLPQVTKE